MVRLTQAKTFFVVGLTQPARPSQAKNFVPPGQALVALAWPAATFRKATSPQKMRCERCMQPGSSEKENLLILEMQQVTPVASSIGARLN